MLKAGQCGTAGGGERGQWCGRGQAAGGGGELIGGANVLAVGVREGNLRGRRNSEEKVYSENPILIEEGIIRQAFHKLHIKPLSLLVPSLILFSR
jgi:hypothetical protein